MAAVLVLVLAACGTSGSASSSATSANAGSGPAATTSDAVAAARVKAAACMRAQGINIPDITPGQGQLLSVIRILGSYPSAKVNGAMKACAASIRQAFPNAESSTPAQRAQRVRAGQVFAQCMRARGIPFPDPAAAASNPSGYFRALGALQTGSPAFRAAETPCRAQALKLAGG